MKRRLIAAFAILVVLGLAAFSWLWFLPCGFGGCAPVSDLQQFQAEGSQLLDINGEPFGMLATVNRRIVPLDSLPPHLPQAFVAIEDQRFYDHGGVDWRRMVGAVRATAGSKLGGDGGLEGGSTITMQLARNLFPEHLPYTDRSVRRKMMEMRVARQIEREFPKDKILELYLNHIYLGEGAYGVEAAALAYFGKSAAELSVAEAAALAATTQSPSRRNPREDPEHARERRDLVLREMAEAGYLSAAEAAEAAEEPTQLAAVQKGGDGPVSSYFIERVRRELAEQVGERFYTGGLQVYTTLDPVAQTAAEEELAQQLDAIEAGRFGSFRHTTYAGGKGVAAETGETPYLQGAVVVMEAATGEVRALVGGRDFTDSKFDRIMQARRQPGSAFKPFVYLTALERGRTPIYKLEDAPVRLTLSGGRVWEPKNYTGRYDGPMTLREALMRSKNSVMVRLAQELGMSSVIRTARDLGVQSDIPDVPSTALGSAAVRPIEMVAAYAAFDNGGSRVEPHFVRRIEDRDGHLLWEAQPQRQQVIEPAAAFVITSMLRDVVDRGTGSAVRSAGFGGAAAGKTGTTNSATDVWFIGYTPDLVGAVWMGMDQPQTIVSGASGGSLAAPVWGRVMQRLYRGRPTPPPWQQPPGVVTEEVDRATGQVISEYCPARGAVYTEYFVNVAPIQTVCQQDGIYPSLAGAGGWYDEEWDTIGGYGDSVYGSYSDDAGIYWPQLDSARTTRGDTAGGYALPPSPRTRTPRDSLLPPDTTRRAEPLTPGRPRLARDSTRTQPPDTAAPEPPPLLGEPVLPDTSVVPPPVPPGRNGTVL